MNFDALKAKLGATPAPEGRGEPAYINPEGSGADTARTTFEAKPASVLGNKTLAARHATVGDALAAVASGEKIVGVGPVAREKLKDAVRTDEIELVRLRDENAALRERVAKLAAALAGVRDILGGV